MLYLIPRLIRITSAATQILPTAPPATGEAFLRGCHQTQELLPVMFHADDVPPFCLCLFIKRLTESADLGIRKPLGGTVGVLALGIIVQHQHRKPCTLTCPGILQNMLITSRIAKGCIRLPANEQVDAFGFASVVIVE